MVPVWSHQCQPPRETGFHPGTAWIRVNPRVQCIAAEGLSRWSYWWSYWRAVRRHMKKRLHAKTSWQRRAQQRHPPPGRRKRNNWWIRSSAWGRKLRERNRSWLFINKGLSTTEAEVMGAVKNVDPTPEEDLQTQYTISGDSGWTAGQHN